MEHALIPYDGGNPIAAQSFNRCYLGKVYFASESRNAWQWTTSRTYNYEDAFALSRGLLQQQIEPQRKQGSAWSRLELAACVFSGSRGSLVVTEINTRTPFKTLKLEMPESPRISHVAECFVPKRKDSVYRFLSPSRLIRPAALPFVHWKSVFRGRALEWEEDLGDILDFDAYYSIDAAVSLVPRFVLWRKAFSE